MSVLRIRVRRKRKVKPKKTLTTRTMSWKRRCLWLLRSVNGTATYVVSVEEGPGECVQEPSCPKCVVSSGEGACTWSGFSGWEAWETEPGKLCAGQGWGLGPSLALFWVPPACAWRAHILCDGGLWCVVGVELAWNPWVSGEVKYSATKPRWCRSLKSGAQCSASFGSAIDSGAFLFGWVTRDELFHRSWTVSHQLTRAFQCFLTHSGMFTAH